MNSGGIQSQQIHLQSFSHTQGSENCREKDKNFLGTQDQAVVGRQVAPPGLSERTPMSHQNSQM